jgi:cell division protein FtsI/penicillin-binding protein 2/LysM repeat protein
MSYAGDSRFYRWILFFICSAFLLISVYAIFNYMFFNMLNRKTDFIVIPSENKLPVKYAAIRRHDDKIIIKAYRDIYLHGNLISEYDLTHVTEIDTFKTGNCQLTFTVMPASRKWESLFSIYMDDLNSRSYSSMNIGSNHLFPRTVLQLDREKLEPLSNEETIITILPPEGEEIFPALLDNRTLKITVADSVVYLARDSVVKQLYPIEKEIAHEVKLGENLYSLSRIYNTSVEKILSVNGLHNSLIRENQKLRIQIPYIYELRNNDILHIGDPSNPKYTLRFRVETHLTETSDDETQTQPFNDSFTIQTLRKRDDIKANSLYMTVYNNGGMVYSKSIDLNNRSLLINQNKLVTALPIPFARNIVPVNTMDLTSYQKQKQFMPDFFAEVIDYLMQNRIYDIKRVRTSGKHLIINETEKIPVSGRTRRFVNSFHWDEFFSRTIRPLSEILYNPGIAFYLETDSLATQRLILSSDQWTVFTDYDSTRKSATTSYREHEFTHNPGKFLTKPYIRDRENETIVFETQFLFNRDHEIVRVLKIAGFTNYQLELNGSILASEIFNFENRDYNLFEDEGIYKFFYDNLSDSNTLRIYLEYDKTKVNPVFPNQIPFHYSFGNSLPVKAVDHEWEYSLSLSKSAVRNPRWSEGKWLAYRGSLSEIFPPGMGKIKASLLFRRELIIENEPADIQIEHDYDTIKCFIDGQLIESSTLLYPGRYILGVEYDFKHIPMFSRRNPLYVFLTKRYLPLDDYLRIGQLETISSPSFSAKGQSTTEFTLIIGEKSLSLSSFPGDLLYVTSNGKLHKNKRPPAINGSYLKIFTNASGKLDIYSILGESSKAADNTTDDPVYKVNDSKKLLATLDTGDSFSFDDRIISLHTRANHMAYDIYKSGMRKRYYSDEYNTMSLVGYDDDVRLYGLEKTFSSLSSDYVVELTINAKMQQIAEEILHRIILEEKKDDRSYINDHRKSTNEDRSLIAHYLQHKKQYQAGIILADREGRILVAASYPGVSAFTSDPEEYISYSSYQKSFNNNISVFDNINWDKRFFPGSSFKVLDALTLFSAGDLLHYSDPRLDYVSTILTGYPPEAGEINLLNSTMLSPGNRNLRVDISNHRSQRCNHGTSVNDAFARSYNTYFSYAMLHLFKASIADERIHLLYNTIDNHLWVDSFPMNYWIDLLGMNSDLTLVDMIHDDRQYTYNSIPSLVTNNALDQYEVAQLAIGQNIVELTPVQQIKILSLFARNDGTYIEPYLVNSIRNRKTGEVIGNKPSHFEKIKKIDKTAYTNVRDIMREVVTSLYGTGRLMKNIERESRFLFYAKTGTADIHDYRNLNHAWFVGFVEDTHTREEYMFVSVFPYTMKQGAEIAGRAIREFLTKIIEEDCFELH